MSTSRRSTRGFTLIEALVSMVVMVIGFLGLASLQIIGVRSNRFGDRMVQASALGTDLVESIHQWSYFDTRLNSLGTIPSTSDSSMGSWDLGTSSATSYQLEYSDLAADTNAATPAALGTYTGLSSDVDGDGTPDFIRYWNVYEVNFDPANSVRPNGKLVQIIVRWKEPGFGYRQITTSAFKRNPAVVSF